MTPRTVNQAINGAVYSDDKRQQANRRDMVQQVEYFKETKTFFKDFQIEWPLSNIVGKPFPIKASKNCQQGHETSIWFSSHFISKVFQLLVTFTAYNTGEYSFPINKFFSFHSKYFLVCPSVPSANDWIAYWRKISSSIIVRSMVKYVSGNVKARVRLRTVGRGKPDGVTILVFIFWKFCQIPKHKKFLSKIC